MSQAIQFRRGTTAQHATFTGLVGEATIDTDKETWVVHDGSTAGGFPMAREDFSNVALPVGLGTTSPAYELDVNGAVGMYAASTETRNFEIGHGRTGNGFSYVDFIGDATYTDFGLRIIRNNTGANTASQINHRGTGPLHLNVQDAGYLSLLTTNTERMRITSAGLVGIGTSSPAQDLHVVGKARIQRATNVTLEITSDNNTGPNPFAIGSNSDLFYIKNQAASGLGTGGNFIQYDEGGSLRLMGTNYIDSAGLVGIGTTPSYLLDLYKSAGTVARIRNTAATGGTPSATHGELVIESTDANMGMQFLGSTTADQRILFSDTAAASGQIVYNHTSNYMALYTSAAERMRITSAGNVGIGTTVPTRHLSVSGNIQFASGGIIECGTTALNTYIAGVVGASGYWAFATNGSQRMRINNVGTVRPGADNTQTIGAASYRWSVVYAGTGTINTSDEREKQQVAALDDAERRVAVALKGLVKKYKYNDAVELKGDDARIHVGVIAQEVVAAFETEGLDATSYALLCYDVWDAELEETDDEGNVTRPASEAGSRYGIRYDELLAFMIQAM